MNPRRIPQYSVHNVRNIAYVNWQSARHYLPGKAHSVESKEAYKAFLRDNVFGPTQVKPGRRISITELILLYQEFASNYYEDQGHQSHYNAMITVALKLEHLYHNVTAADFGPKMLKEFRSTLVEDGNSRDYVNDQINRVRKIFKWAVSEELIPVETYQALATVSGLKRGQEGVKDTAKRQPAAWDDVEAIAKVLHEPVSTMVYFQWHTGQRSMAIVQAHADQFKQDADGMWIWEPRHKTEYLGKTVRIPLGPKAAKLVGARLEEGGLLFPTRLGTTYKTWTYRQAILRAQESLYEAQCKQHEKEPQKHPKPKLIRWTPHQIRHAKGHHIRSKYGVEAAQALLGHDSLQATEIYSEKRFQLAKQIAAKEG